eukprot:1160599-Pelagomonas_calceolata.AAC.22
MSTGHMCNLPSMCERALTHAGCMHPTKGTMQAETRTMLFGMGELHRAFTQKKYCICTDGLCTNDLCTRGFFTNGLCTKYLCTNGPCIHDLCTHGLCTNSLRTCSLCTHGLCTNGLNTDGFYTHNLCTNGPCFVQPDSGRLEAYRVPGGPGIRLDGAVTTGNVMSRYYDSLLAKVIASAPTFGYVCARARLQAVVSHTGHACNCGCCERVL